MKTVFSGFLIMVLNLQKNKKLKTKKITNGPLIIYQLDLDIEIVIDLDIEIVIDLGLSWTKSL